MDTNARRPGHARNSRLAAVFALVAMFIPALAGVASACASPTITTTTGGPVVIGSGAKLTDTAHLTGGSSPTGTITFTLTDPTSALRDTETATVSGNGNYSTPSGFLPDMVGTWHWVASYGGDAKNNKVASGAKEEPLTVSPASPAITTTTGGPVVIGSGAKLTDTAHLTGGSSPTGTITFTLTDPTSALRDTETATVSGNGNYSTPSGFLPDMVGTWHWVASYGGDAKNNKVASGAKEEPLTVRPAGPTIATVLSKSKGTVGDTIHDTATLTGTTATARGKVTYTVYTNTACTSGAIDAGTKTVTNGSVPNSDGIVFNSVGTWYWQAVYSGDASNAAATSACTEETLVVDPTPSASTSATPTPFEWFQGETATPVRVLTPPPTSSGSGPSGDSSTPLLALVISFALGGLGLAAVEAQRRSIRR